MISKNVHVFTKCLDLTIKLVDLTDMKLIVYIWFLVCIVESKMHTEKGKFDM